MNSYLIENEKEEQNNCIREEKMESTTQIQLKSSKSREDLELCVKIGERVERIDNATRLFYQIKKDNAFFILFYRIIRQTIHEGLFSTNALKFMVWILKIIQNTNREFSEVLKIKDYLLKEVGLFILFRDHQFDRGYICEQLMKLENIEKNLEEKKSKIMIPLEIEICLRITKDKDCFHILSVMCDRIAEAIPEIKEINQEDIEEYEENVKKLYNQFGLL